MSRFRKCTDGWSCIDLGISDNSKKCDLHLQRQDLRTLTTWVAGISKKKETCLSHQVTNIIILQYTLQLKLYIPRTIFHKLEYATHMIYVDTDINRGFPRTHTHIHTITSCLICVHFHDIHVDDSNLLCFRRTSKLTAKYSLAIPLHLPNPTYNLLVSGLIIPAKWPNTVANVTR